MFYPKKYTVVFLNKFLLNAHFACYFNNLSFYFVAFML